MADQEFDKSELPTPYKLQEARKKGQVAKSMEINSWLILLVAFGLFLSVGWNLITALGTASQFLFSQAADIKISISVVIFTISEAATFLRKAMWPLFLGLFVISALSTLVQIGFLFTFQPLKPDMNRLNPIDGFKRLFSLRMLFETFKTTLKLVLLIGVYYLFLKKLLPTLPLLYDMSPYAVIRFLQTEATTLIATLIGTLVFIALLDLVFSRRDFTNKMKMSKREVKEEAKRREGDPLVRQKRRQIQQELSSQLGSIGNTKNADVVITNPTHLSIALKYERGVMTSPYVIAKGSGAAAFKMRQLARKHNIEIVENKPLARVLFRTTSVNQPIAPEHFPVVAQIYIWLHKRMRSEKVLE